jgi:hypothetical protein
VTVRELAVEGTKLQRLVGMGVFLDGQPDRKGGLPAAPERSKTLA